VHTIREIKAPIRRRADSRRSGLSAPRLDTKFAVAAEAAKLPVKVFGTFFTGTVFTTATRLLGARERLPG